MGRVILKNESLQIFWTSRLIVPHIKFAPSPDKVWPRERELKLMVGRSKSSWPGSPYFIGRHPRGLASPAASQPNAPKRPSQLHWPHYRGSEYFLSLKVRKWILYILLETEET